jgi:RimJ/RimL family protein N-acetyltransferase
MPVLAFSFLLSTLIMIRPAGQENFDFIYQLYMHPDNNPWLLYEQMTRDEFYPVFNELIARGHLYIFHEEGKDKGMFKLQPMKYRNSHIIYLGGVAVDAGSRQQGVGGRMMADVLDKVREMGFTRVELTVGTENIPAIHLYEKAGFEIEGRLKNYSYLKSENRYIDEYVMGLIL